MSSPQPPLRVSLLDQLQHGTRQTRPPAAGRFEQTLAAPGQMAQALLVSRHGEAVVNAPAVVDQRARPIAPKSCSAGWPLRVGSIT